MGMLDKIKAKLASLGPDHGAMLRDALPADEVFLANATVVPAAFERGGGQADIFKAGINAVSSAMSKNKHVSGEPGSMARSLPLSGETRIMAVTSRGLSVWDFGVMMNEPATTPEYRIAREHITSFVDTGQRAQGGSIIWHVTFVDGSTFGYRSLGSSEGFADAVAQLRG